MIPRYCRDHTNTMTDDRRMNEQRTMQSHSGSSSTASTSIMTSPAHCDAPGRRRKARAGDIVTIDFTLTPENGFVPHPLFDTSGIVSFVLGWGNYLPGLHALIDNMAVGHECHNVSIDAGWGKRNPELVVKVAKKKINAVKDIDTIQEGTKLHLGRGIDVEVIEVTEDFIVVDANPPLAGASYSCDLTLLEVENFPLRGNTPCKQDSRYQVTTFALGCFWGGELAFMRVPGVVGTKVGYTQGIKHNPTYEEVCTGTTKHREAIQVVYDSQVVSYKSLLDIALNRLASTSSQFKLSTLFDDEVTQYRNGFYYHSEEQRLIAEAQLASDNKFQVELLAATEFFDAEENHQQYLLKGGQSARKAAKETIRCFG